MQANHAVKDFRSDKYILLERSSGGLRFRDRDRSLAGGVSCTPNQSSRPGNLSKAIWTALAQMGGALEIHCRLGTSAANVGHDQI